MKFFITYLIFPAAWSLPDTTEATASLANCTSACPLVYEPVCALDRSKNSYVSFSNDCSLLKSKCETGKDLVKVAEALCEVGLTLDFYKDSSFEACYLFYVGCSLGPGSGRHLASGRRAKAIVVWDIVP